MVGGESKGYTAEEAASTHIKQCPHCMYIFGKEKKHGSMDNFIYGTPKGNSRMVGSKKTRKVVGKKK